MDWTGSEGAELGRDRGELTDGDVVLELTASSAGALPARCAALLRLKEAVRQSYESLIRPVAVQVETVAMLEEVPSHRATAWMRVHVEGSASAAAARAPAPSLLKSAAHGTIAILRWMNLPGQPRLRHLRQAIDALSTGTAREPFDERTAPRSADLATAIRAWQHACGALQTDDRVRLITRQGCAEIDADLVRAHPTDILVEKRVVNPSTDMIFVVDLPDYAGTGMWKLKHGDTQVVASCASGTLLDRFYGRELDIRPGDALHCRVEFETAYGPDYEVISETFRILDVVEVLTATQPVRAGRDVGRRPDLPVGESLRPAPGSGPRAVHEKAM